MSRLKGNKLFPSVYPPWLHLHRNSSPFELPPLHRLNTLSAKGQGDVLSRGANLDLAASGRDASRPNNSRAAGIGTGLDQLAAGEGITKDIAEVIPDLVAVEGVGKDGLGLAGVEAVLGLGDLEGLATGDGVLDERLRVGAGLGGYGVDV